MRRARSGPGAPPRSDRRRMRAMGGVRGSWVYRRSRAYLVLSRSDRRDATGGGGDDLAAGTAHSVGPARAESGADARVHGSRSRHVFVGFQVVPGGVAGATVRSSRFQDGALSEDIFFFSFCVSRPPSFASPNRQSPAAFRGFGFGVRFRPRLPTSDSGVRLRTIAPRRPSSLSVRGAHSRLGWPLRAARGPPRATRHRRL